MKSLFQFSKQQQIGIFLLLLIILLLQGVIYFVNSKAIEEIYAENKDAEFYQFQKELDSLQVIASKKAVPKIYPFNPNFITDYKGYALGMTSEEINRIAAYRRQGRWIHSVKQFQKVTRVSDSLLSQLAPYFKFPEWTKQTKRKSLQNKTILNKAEVVKTDLNKATLEQLKSVYGIGKVLAARILDYRNTHHGFVDSAELTEIYGLKGDVIANLKEKFDVLTPRRIQKINLNTATSAALVTVKYIDYEIAYQIIEYRNLHNGFQSIKELLKVEGFPLEKYPIIKLYLHLN